MVSTRSKTQTQTQTHLDDFTPKDSTLNKAPASDKPTAKRKATAQTEAAASKKRKPSSPTSRKRPAKQAKTSKPAANKDVIVINRAPVLHLWSACVTHFLYPSLPWSTCLSAGSAISTICAISKGRSIGTVSEKDESEAAESRRRKEKRKQKDLDEVEVMDFRLKLKDGLTLVGSEARGKPGSEDALRKKFDGGSGGGEGGAYEKVKKCFEDVLGEWEGEEEELSRRGFGFYEEFRPEVGKGQKGWGRKGELSLEKVREVVGRGLVWRFV
ncbi:hypothetical protein CC80DRAFT_594687 [Byssothecium circinans]|uniref:Uncharacterized protein n=1 Tax=Byssothecium circinans TaxID=147558 RepID=A0A6A5TS11_9PLEO|nr:hypothetical protein CC80DRAFT_594687 [Byssothecium circinans]